MSLQNETRKKSLFKIKYRKKKSLPQVPLVIVEQCDRDLNNTTTSSSSNNNNNDKCPIEKTKHPITTTNTVTTTTTSTADLYCIYLYNSPKHFKLCRLKRHSLNCLDDVKNYLLPNVLYKYKSCTDIKPKTSEDELDIYLQGIVNDTKRSSNMTSACNPSQEHECSSVVGLCMSNSLNDPFLNISMNKTIFQNVCKISPASIQRAKRMEFIKMSNTQQNHPNNCLLNKNIQISFLEDNVNKLKSTHSLPEENRVQYDKMYTRPISSSYSPSTDTELVTTPNSDHVFPTKKDNNELYKLFPMYIRNDIPNSSSCSSFNSLGIISSPPSINTSDTHLNDKDKFSQLSNVELYHRKLSIIESKVTKSSQSLHLLLPRTTFAFYNNSVQKPSIINNNEQSLYHRINDKKSIINKSRIKSLGDIFKIPRLSFSNEVYPKKSCTYQNINKMIVDNNKIDNNDHGLRSQFELPLGTKDNHDHDSNHKVYTNYLTVPCETTMMLRKKSQIFNQYIRYSTEYVSTTETIKENEQQRKQRAVSVDICQTNKLFHLFDHKNDLNRKSKDYKQLLYDSQSSKLRQQQQNQGNIESLHTSSSTLCSFIPATPNWTNAAIIGEHLWNETTSNETCYIDESECTKSGAKRKCSVCHIVCHVNCLPLVQVSCRPTFREAFIHDYRTEKTYTTHHWIKRRKQNKKCKQCGKSLQSILGFSSKEYITIQCTWCKIGYHNKSSCFRESYLTEPCSLGSYSDLIVPPDWIIKLTERNDYKLPSSSSLSSSTSICRSSSFVTPSCLSNCDENINQIRSLISRPNSLDHSNHIINNNNISDQLSSKTSITTVHEDIQPISISQANIYIEPKISFVIKTNPINTASLKPILVFLNPKSGGNQGLNLLKKFQWLLNPRQVFDVSKGGPKMGLELFSRVPNLRILVCGGDGTVGWIFSTIDLMNFNTIPPVAVLPLGTGNDLARALNWGSGYIDESVSKVLNSVYEGRVIALDRWQVNSEVRTDFQTTQQLTDYEDDDSTRNRPISDVLPLKVFNNYFSLGADAATALQFHESREANPEKFNSRLKNKLFYAGLGGKDLLRRSWRDLSEHITLICDDKDLTPLIRSLKPHCILFLNIPRYGSGTLPWGQPTTEFQPQRIDDGYIEVIGLTSTSLATLQIGGHGDRICQCRRVHLTTDIVIPMQMDGEPCRLMPSKIDIFCSHQALVIQKLTRSPISAVMSNEDENHLQWKTIGYETRINVFVIALKNYDKMSDDVISLRQTAIWIGIITAKYDTDLSTVRKIITQLNEDTIQDHLYNENSESMETNLKFRVHLSDSWVFIDSTTAASRFFRIDKEQENVHFLTDVCNMEDLFLIDSILESHLTYNNPTTDSFMDDNVLHPLPPPTSLLRDDNDNQLNQFGAKASNLTASDNQNENNDDDDDDDDDDNSIDDGDNDDEDDDDCMNKTQTKNLFISTNNMSVEGEIFIPSIND